MLSMEEARFKILREVPSLGCESVGLLEARGRTLQEELHSPVDMPSFSNTAMDGYALRSEDTASASEEHPVELKVTQLIQASHWPEVTLEPGEAARIFTGAPLPPGADAVELQENVSADEATQRVTLTKPVPQDKSIRKQGAYLQKGEVLLPQGTQLEAGEIGLLASVGRGQVRVKRRPRVAILSCGDELVPLHDAPQPGQIYESNRYALGAQIEEAGAIPMMLPLVPDDPAQIREQLKAGLQADVLISSGGVSVGAFDLIRPAMEEVGIELIFWKVAIKPGKPLAFGRKGDCLFFGLPGNPGSSMVTFELFVRPALRKMLGCSKIFRPKVKAILAADARPTSGRTHFVRGQMEVTATGMRFTPYGHQGSGNLLSMRGAEALAVLGPGTTTVSAGTEVDVLLLSSQWGMRGVDAL